MPNTRKSELLSYIFSSAHNQESLFSTVLRRFIVVLFEGRWFEYLFQLIQSQYTCIFIFLIRYLLDITKLINSASLSAISGEENERPPPHSYVVFNIHTHFISFSLRYPVSYWLIVILTLVRELIGNFVFAKTKFCLKYKFSTNGGSIFLFMYRTIYTKFFLLLFQAIHNCISL